MTKTKRLIIIDGKSVFYRGYYAMGYLSTKDGIPTGGVYGFAAMALEIIKRLQPDYVCVAWDKPKTNIRRRLKVYPDYKAGRKAAPADFYVQIPILQELLAALNWPFYELDDYEADDIMCGLAKKASAVGVETLLITSDLDALQCLGPLIKVYALKKGLTNVEEFSAESFQQKYGLQTDQFLDLKALKGDSSDNIPGVKGIGDKTATELLRQYQTLDGVYENIALIKDTVRKKLEAGRDSAYMSKEIAQLYDDAPIELDLPSMAIENLDTEELASVLTKLEFKSLLRNLPDGMKSSTAAVIGQSSSVAKLSMPQVHHINNQATLDGFSLSGEVVLSARSAGPHGERPSVLLLADAKQCLVLDLRRSFKPDLTAILPKEIIGYDTKTSLKVLLALGCPLPRVRHDAFIAAFVINCLQREQSLSQLASSLLGYEAELDQLDDDQYIVAADQLCAVIRGVCNMQGEQMSELSGLISLVEAIEWPVIPVLARIERVGMKLNTKFMHKLDQELSEQISDLEQIIYGFADQEFNIASPTQLSGILFQALQLPTAGVKKSKNGAYSTAVGVLEKLKQHHPIIEHIERYRELTKLRGTYVEPLPKMVDSNSRVHSTLRLTIAQTGRLSSFEPNLQNIPVRTDMGRRIRQAFVAEPGKLLISADYSQFELRIAAALSKDKAMIEAFNHDRDIHIETAALIHEVPTDQVTKQMRYAAKAVNFGILYGQGVHGLSEGTGISYIEAKKFIDRYFEVRPSLKTMMDAFRNQAKDKGFVETLLGRRRPTPDVQSNNFIVREAAYRAAINMPIQGTAADLTKLAMVKIEDKLPDGAFQIMQVHDSIMVECQAQQADTVASMMKRIMETVYPELGIKLKVDVTIGINWGEL